MQGPVSQGHSVFLKNVTENVHDLVGYLFN